MKLKSAIYLVIVFIFAFSCKKRGTSEKYIPRTIKSINLKKFDHQKFGLEKMNSIRSIELVDSTAFFIANSGKIYAFYPNGNFLITPNNFFKEKKPNFRASGNSKYNLYALSIDNPALLYQIKMNKNDGLTSPKIVYKEEGEKVFYDAMNFFDSNNGIAIGDPTENCLSIILTADGGNSWNKIDCNKLPKLIDGEAVFAASNTNIAIVGSHAWIITGAKQSRVLHTADKGLTWDITTTPLLYGTKSSGGYSIAFYDKMNGIICGGDYLNKTGNLKNKAITKDGGKSWHLVANGQAPGYISCVQYVPNTNGKELFAVSTEGIYFSNNSGLSWLKVNNEGYYTIRFIDKNTAWLAGNGKIAKMILN